LKTSLLAFGFKETTVSHRVISPGNLPVDIVPFGQIEDEHSNISRPPDGDWVMNVLGFREACEQGEYVRIRDDSPLDIPVVTTRCMVVMKLIAWADRAPYRRRKDAKDLIHLFSNDEKIPVIQNGLRENQNLMEAYDWDLELAGAYQLGVDSRALAVVRTCEVISRLFHSEHQSLSVGLLIEYMSEQIDREYARHEKLTQAFIDGFLYEA
jgi:predicted nucleotidyltransferase